MEQNRVLDIIINLLIGIKNDNKLIGKSCNDEEILLNGCSYLLNQTIRQYQFPESHYFVSEKAQELWNKISSDDIFNYVYRDTVTKDIEGVVVVDKFRGGEGTPYAKESIVKGDKFIYKDVFSDEHIVTVSDVIKELLDLSNFDYESVEKILNKIYICKMLKSEDRSIMNKKSRSTDYREVILNDYYDVDIRVRGIDYISIAEARLAEAKEELELLEKNQTINITSKVKGAEMKIGETFTFTNEKTFGYGIKDAYKAYNSKNENVGFVFMTNDMRTSSYGCAELRFYTPYKGKTWCRFTSRGVKIDWKTLSQLITEKGKCKYYID